MVFKTLDIRTQRQRLLRDYKQTRRVLPVGWSQPGLHQRVDRAWVPESRGAART